MVWIEWCTAVVALAGVILNIKKRRACFALWLVTNTTWIVIDARAGLYGQATLFAVYAVLAVWGWISWKPKKEIWECESTECQ